VATLIVKCVRQSLLRIHVTSLIEMGVNEE
jgi:hypothetical protein